MAEKIIKAIISLRLVIDYVFKNVFGKKGNEDLLEDFLNSIIYHDSDKKISGIKYLDPHNGKDFDEDKKSILDIKFEDSVGNLYDVEMQVYASPSYLIRSIYYVAKIFVSQARKGLPYKKFKKAVGISLIENTSAVRELFFEDDDYITKLLIQKENGHIKSDAVTLYLVDLSQFEHTSQKISDRGRKWLNLMLNSQYIDPDNPPEEYRGDKIFEKVFEELKRMIRTEEDVRTYNIRRDARDSQAAMMIEFEEFFEEKGRREGIQEGIEKGKIETVINLKNMRMGTSFIATATGLSEQEVEDILRDANL